ncbi:MAG TPA: ArsA-related P-loop ATPase [Roseiflexaceae bacterium]|nr:ArsA-related P-loop ATPase [Roseiflexaceae bacterium]
MTTLILTGNAGSGVAIAACGAALHAAAAGRRTLLVSFGSPQHLAALLGVAPAAEPAPAAPGLDALALDPLAEMATAWTRGRAQLPDQLARIPPDELPLLPGSDVFLGLARLGTLLPRYETVVVDAGPHETVLRTLATPDSLRWLVRLLLGLDRGPGRSPGSAARALLPTTFIPADLRDRAQDLRIQAEEARGALVEPGRTAVQYVLRPDGPALADAQLAIPALHLHGLAVAALLVGPGLPTDVADPRLAPLAARQAALIEAARAHWPDLPVLPFEQVEEGPEGLRATGAALAGAPVAAAPPILYQYEGAPAVAIRMPGLPRGALQLTLSGDELIIRVGPYRRHILLPEGLRGHNDIRATREGEQLVVRRRA